MIDFFFSLALIGLALDHLITGIIGVFLPYRGLAILNKMFGTNIPPEARYALLMRPWGAMGIFIAFIGILPLLDVKKYELILYGMLILLLLRIFIRLDSARTATTSLSLSFRRNLIHIGLIVACIIAISTKLLVQFV